jgi:hypothetical protein
MASEVMETTINDDEWFSSEREPRTDHEREFLHRVRDLSDGSDVGGGGDGLFV